jgi:hypothetical protein
MRFLYLAIVLAIVGTDSFVPLTTSRSARQSALMMTKSNDEGWEVSRRTALSSVFLASTIVTAYSQPAHARLEAVNR